jgi:hypothetical protein
MNDFIHTLLKRVVYFDLGRYELTRQGLLVQLEMSWCGRMPMVDLSFIGRCNLSRTTCIERFSNLRYEDVVHDPAKTVESSEREYNDMKTIRRGV